MKTKNILIIHPSLGSGGAEKIIAFLANVLNEHYSVDLMLLKKDKITLPLNDGISIVEKDCYANMPIISRHMIKGIKSLKLLVREIQTQYRIKCYDLVVCFDLRVLLATYFALKKDADKILFSERADPYENKRYWAMLLSYIYKKIGYIVFQTNGAQTFYGEKIKIKSSVIHNPALSRELTQNNDLSIDKNKEIFAAGRLQYRKGFDLLIQAFSQIASSYPDYTLKIYGEGEEKQHLLELIQTLKLEDRVYLLPPTPNVVEKNKEAYLFVLPSRSEGIPNIMIEAMLLGVPCVATDCSPGGAKLLSADGEYALLASNNDSNSLAKQIEYAIINPQEMCFMSKRAQEGILRFEPKSIGKEWTKVVENQIERK